MLIWPLNAPVNGIVANPQVKARLHTLEYIYDNSRLVLNTEQIKSLWAHLGPSPAIPAPRGNGVDALNAARVAEAGAAGMGGAIGATPGEVSTLLSWLSKACEACEGEGGGGMFEPGVAAELFRVRVVCYVLCAACCVLLVVCFVLTGGTWVWIWLEAYVFFFF